MDEKKLVEDILKGREVPLRQFYKLYKDKLFSFIKSKVDSGQDSEEIMQDTLLDALEGLRDFTFRSSLYTYLCAIAKHKVVDFYRKKKIKAILLSQIPQNIKPLISHILNPDEQFEAIEKKMQIRKILTLLKPIYSKVLVLKYHQGFTVAEIAEDQLLTIKSVESLLVRARREFIKKYRFLYQNI